MSAEWMTDEGPPWAMRCDECDYRIQTATRPDLRAFAEAGWFIAQTVGDCCPSCVAAGKVGSTEPHRVYMDGLS